MGQNTNISWCDMTWSPWIGCTKVSPGCDHCYAEALDRRHRYGCKPGDGMIGAPHWGAGKPRYRTRQWDQPVKWNAAAEKAGVRRTVFPSLCDPFDNEVPSEWRADLWALIRSTPNLTWLLLTKRIGIAGKMIGLAQGTGVYSLPVALPNVWIGASVVNQEEADRDIPKLLATPAAKRFVSYEPALGPVDFTRIVERIAAHSTITHDALAERGNSLGRGRITPRLDWIIVGGESSQGGAKARPFDLAWARQTVQQCKAAGVPVFVKQLGSNPIREAFPPPGTTALHGGWQNVTRFKDRAGANPAEWPEDLRVQEFPT